MRRFEQLPDIREREADWNSSAFDDNLMFPLIFTVQKTASVSGIVRGAFATVVWCLIARIVVRGAPQLTGAHSTCC